jgi:hypothetical protein
VLFCAGLSFRRGYECFGTAAALALTALGAGTAAVKNLFFLISIFTDVTATCRANLLCHFHYLLANFLKPASHISALLKTGLSISL